MYTVPGRTIKKELARNIVMALLSGKIDVITMDKIFREIEQAEYTTSDPSIIIQAKEAGLCSEQTASMALGFPKDEYLQAREDHAERARRILLAQTSVQQGGGENPAARGVPDASIEPEKEGQEERGAATETTLKETTKKPVRGGGRNTKKKGD